MIKENIYKKQIANKNMKKEWDVWDYLIWGGIIALLAWALLKSLGVIHSPVWVDMIPYEGIGIASIGAVYKLGKIKKGIEETDKKVDKLLSIEERFSKIEHEHNFVMQGKTNIKH